MKTDKFSSPFEFARIRVTDGLIATWDDGTPTRDFTEDELDALDPGQHKHPIWHKSAYESPLLFDGWEPVIL